MPVLACSSATTAHKKKRVVVLGSNPGTTEAAQQGLQRVSRSRKVRPPIQELRTRKASQRNSVCLAAILERTSDKSWFIFTLKIFAEGVLASATSSELRDSFNTTRFGTSSSLMISSHYPASNSSSRHISASGIWAGNIIPTQTAAPQSESPLDEAFRTQRCGARVRRGRWQREGAAIKSQGRTEMGAH